MVLPVYGEKARRQFNWVDLRCSGRFLSGNSSPNYSEPPSLRYGKDEEDDLGNIMQGAAIFGCFAYRLISWPIKAVAKAIKGKRPHKEKDGLTYRLAEGFLRSVGCD